MQKIPGWIGSPVEDERYIKYWIAQFGNRVSGWEYISEEIIGEIESIAREMLTDCIEQNNNKV